MSRLGRVAVLMTCHNRVDTTRRCLVSLAGQRLAEGRTMQVLLNDDGSTDGTADAAAEFGQVRVLRGSGRDYWAGGMRRAWAAADRTDADAYVLLNDDVVLDDDAVETLIGLLEGDRDAVWGAAVRDPATGAPSYGGHRAGRWWRPMRSTRVAPGDRAQGCDFLNGNVLVLTRPLAAALDGLDPAFAHGMADFDLTWRARKAGYEVRLAPGTWGSCAPNSPDGTWRDTSLSRRERLARLRRPTGLPARAWWTYCRRHGGVAAPYEFAAPYLRVVLGR